MQHIARDDALFVRPRGGFGVPFAVRDVLERVAALRLGRAAHAPDKGEDLRDVAGVVGHEQTVIHTGRDVVLDRPVDGGDELGIGRHIGEADRGFGGGSGVLGGESRNGEVCAEQSGEQERGDFFHEGRSFQKQGERVMHRNYPQLVETFGG